MKSNQMETPSLKHFYQVIQEWIDSGCPEDNNYNFDSLYGLCSNIEEYMQFMYENSVNINSINTELPHKMLFSWEGVLYPFNEGSHDYYNEENKYTNPRRLAWIKEQLAL